MVLVTYNLIIYGVLFSISSLRNSSIVVSTIKAILHLTASGLTSYSSQSLRLTIIINCLTSNSSSSSSNLVDSQRRFCYQEVSNVVSGLTNLLIQSNSVNTSIGDTHFLSTRNGHIQQGSKNISLFSIISSNKASCCVKVRESIRLAVPILSNSLSSNCQRLLGNSNSTNGCFCYIIIVCIACYSI